MKQLRHSVLANRVAALVQMAHHTQETLPAEYAAAGTDLGRARLAAVEDKHKALTLLCGERTNLVSFAVADIVNLWTELGVDRAAHCTSPLELQIQRTEPGKLGIGRDIIAQLDTLKAALVALKASRAAEAARVMSTLTDLWTRLNVSAADRHTFIATVEKATFTPATMQLVRAAPVRHRSPRALRLVCTTHSRLTDARVCRSVC